MDRIFWKLWKQPAILKKTGKNEEKNPVKLKITCKKKKKPQTIENSLWKNWK